MKFTYTVLTEGFSVSSHVEIKIPNLYLLPVKLPT